MKPPKNKFIIITSLIITLLGIIGVIYLTIYWIGGEESIQVAKSLWQDFKDFLLSNGFWLFLSIAILPGFILPCAPLLILAGIWGTEFGIAKACIYSIGALVINLIWTYWFACGAGNKIVNIILNKFNHKIPELPSQNLLRWSFILRLTPGVPFIFTNYILGLLKMPFLKYLFVSIPIISITDCGFILASAGIFGEGWKYIWGGISILIVMIVGGKLISVKKKYAN